MLRQQLHGRLHVPPGLPVPLHGVLLLMDGTIAQVNGHAPPLELHHLGPALTWPQQREEPSPAPAAPAPAARRSYPWPLLLIAAPAAVAIWSGWVGLGALCGFGLVQPFPGIVSWHLDTAITLPVGIESYAAYALYVWLGTRAAGATREFARNSALGALALGMLGQVASHLLAVAGWAAAPWPVVVGVACLPVVTLAFAAALFHRVRADVRTAPDEVTAEVSEPSSDGQPDDQDEVSEPPPPKPPRRQPRQSKLARAVAVLKRNPGLDDAEVMKRARVSASTVQRARKEVKP